MAFEGSNSNSSFLNFVHKSVLCVNPAEIVTAKIVLEHFRLSETGFRVKFDVGYQLRNFLLNFLIAGCLPPL